MSWPSGRARQRFCTFKCPKTIRNYVSAIKLMHQYLHVSSPALCSFELSLILCSLDINMRHVPHQRLPITPDILHGMCSLCDSRDIFGQVLKCAILFSFYGFFPQSNLVPHTRKTFDTTRHTCRGDVISHKPGLIIILKWSKTSQSSHKHELIPFPEIHGHRLCPVCAYNEMVTSIPTTSPNQPLFVFPSPSHRRGNLNHWRSAQWRNRSKSLLAL